MTDREMVAELKSMGFSNAQVANLSKIDKFVLHRACKGTGRELTLPEHFNLVSVYHVLKEAAR